MKVMAEECVQPCILDVACSTLDTSHYLPLHTMLRQSVLWQQLKVECFALCSIDDECYCVCARIVLSGAKVGEGVLFVIAA